MIGTELLSRATATKTSEVMLSLSDSIESQIPIADRSGVTTIESRFGHILVNYDEKIFMEKGVLGMPDKQFFSVLSFPVRKFDQFQLFQSLEETALSFIVLPVELQNDVIEEKDMREAVADIGMQLEHVQFFSDCKCVS
jgi:hypothetical protein